MRVFDPFRPRLAAVVATVALAVVGCGNWQRIGEKPGPTTQKEIMQIFDANAMFARMGRLVSAENVPYVGSVAFVPGPRDSTVAIVAISLANHVFAFERNGAGFAARYRIEYEFTRAGAPPVVVSRDKSLVVASFQETMRIDESVIEQQRISLVPGSYQLTVRVRDIGNAQTGTATLKVVAPPYGPSSYTAPIIAYSLHGRVSRDDSLSIVLNPRGTVAYGGDTLLIYLEGNGYTKAADLPVEVRDERDSLVTRVMVHFTGTGQVEGRVIRIAPDSAPLGQLEILAGPDNAVHDATPANRFVIAPGGDAIHRTNAIVSFSSAWVVTNFDDLLSLLRYFGQDKKVEAMRRAKGTDRIALWEEFYKSTDPIPATPENEALDQYFGRVAIANQRFHETGVEGWRTDRGEVFIVLGEPDRVVDQSAQLQNAGRIIRWEYNQFNAILYFQDVTGFGRFELSMSQRATFELLRSRVQHDNQ
jgi:GWxTD domain-containing protein